jgi:hypothetical protein
MANKLSPSTWLTTGAACAALGISDKQLWRLRDELFKQGTHYRNIARPQAARPTYRWHLARIEALLDLSQEQRGA